MNGVPPVLRAVSIRLPILWPSWQNMYQIGIDTRSAIGLIGAALETADSHGHFPAARAAKATSSAAVRLGVFICRHFGNDPLIDSRGQPMHWVGRLSPQTLAFAAPHPFSTRTARP